MPPKKVEKKEIVQVFEELTSEDARQWWEYTDFNEEDTQKVEEFFNNYQVELKDLVSQTDIGQTVRVISEKMGIITHPQFAEDENASENEQSQIGEQQEGNKDESKFPNMNNTQQQQEGGGDTQQINNAENMKNYIILENNRYDYATFKIILFHYQNVQELNVFKFANNNLSLQNSRQLFEYIGNPENTKVQKFFFDWNPFVADLTLELYPKLATSNIEFLILRSNQIDCQVIKVLCEQIKARPDCQIKHLELFNNKIGKEGIAALGDLISEYMKFEYLSLAQNGIDSMEDLKPLTNNIGYSVLDEEGLAKYQEEEKERDEMLAQKAKKKKVDEVRLAELQKMLPLKELGQEGSGVFAYVRNPQMKIFNLAMNPFQDKEKQLVEEFIKNLPEDFSLILVHSNFEQKTKEKIRGKYKKNVLV